MKIAHVAIATPGKCGLYETTRELVAFERELGVDARIVDPAPTAYHPGSEDRGVPIEEVAWAQEADVLVDHSGLDADGLGQSIRKPVVFVSHGRPASTFWGERNGRAPAISYWAVRNKDSRYKAVATFWPEHAAYLKEIWDETPVHVIPPSVDLDFWKPGPNGHAFAGKRGKINVIVSDMWRDDVDPFTSLAAFLLFAKRNEGTRLHIYGLPNNRKAINVYLGKAKERGQLGVAMGHVTGLEHVYRSADMLISPNKIYTRTIREAMACGLQVVSGLDADPSNLENFVAVMEDRLIQPRKTREAAEKLFDPRETARKFLEVVNGCDR